MSDRHVKIGFSLWPIGFHASAWRLPEATQHGAADPRILTDAIRTAERGTFDYFFMGSGLVSIVDRSSTYHFNRNHADAFKLDSFGVTHYAAAVSEHIGLVATVNSTYQDPFLVAREAATLDHLSRGRAAVNIITGNVPAAAHNFGRTEHPDGDFRYERAAEFVEVLRALWDSWEDGWLVGDKRTGQLLDLQRSHPIDFQGKHFGVRGPLNVPRPPQGQIPIIHAGDSEHSREFGAEFADIRFIRFTGTPAQQREYYADGKARLAAYGRDPQEYSLLPGLAVYPGNTRAEARAKFRHVQELSVLHYSGAHLSETLGVDVSGAEASEKVAVVVDRAELGERAWIVDEAFEAYGDDAITLAQLFGYLGNKPFDGTTVVGSGEDVADWIEEQFTAQTLDGVVLFNTYLPGNLDDFVNLVVPELQRRGLFRKSYDTSTFREHFQLPAKPNRFSAADHGKR